MGNADSTRWNDHVKARTVEQCMQLEITVFTERDLLRGPLTGGTLTLGTDLRLGVVIDTTGEHERLLGLQWQVTDLLGTTQTFEQWIVLTYVRPTRGTAAWRFQCPSWRGDESCGRRAAKLYLPSGDRTFACRQCWGLVYRSSQASGTYQASYRRMVGQAKEAGIALADAGLDLDAKDGAKALRDLVEGR